MLCYLWRSMGRVLLFAALGCWCAWQEIGEACCRGCIWCGCGVSCSRWSSTCSVIVCKTSGLEVLKHSTCLVQLQPLLLRPMLLLVPSENALVTLQQPVQVDCGPRELDLNL
jgi:hypothetical protein